MAGLVEQKIDIPLAVGMDSKMDAKLLDSGKLVVAENVVLNTVGRASKRNGFAERSRSIFGGTTSITAGDALDTFKDELLLFNGPNFYSWADGVQRWQSKGFIVPVVVGGRSAARSIDRQRTVPDAATVAGQTVFAYEDSSNGVRATVIDDVTGNILQSDVLMNVGGANPKVVAFTTPNVIAVIYRVTNDLRVKFYTPAAGSFSAEFTPTNDCNSTPQIAAISAFGKCVIAYRTTGPILKLATLLETGAFASSVYPASITIPEDPTNAIDVIQDPVTNWIWLAWHNAAGIRGAVRNSDFTNGMPKFTFVAADVSTGADTISHAGNGLAADTLVQLSNSGGALPAGFSASTNYYAIAGDPAFQLSASEGPGAAVNITGAGTGTQTLQVYAATIESIASIRNITGAKVSGTQVRWFYEQSAGATYNYLVKSNTFTNAGVAGTAAVFKRGVGLASKAWIYNGTTYVGLAFDSTLQGTYFVADSSGNIIAKLLPLIGGGVTAKSSSLARVRVDSAGTTFRFAASAKQRLVSENDDQYFLKGTWDAELRFTDPVLHLGATLGDNLHVVGGALWGYDGNAAVELGFHYFPENMSAAQTTSGSLTLLGVYLYAVVYEWVDAKGQLHRSAPGMLGVTMTSSNNKVTLTIPTLRLSAKSGVSIAVYRTAAAGSVLYRISSLVAGSLTLNNAAADTVSYVDTAADTAIITSEELYTNGVPAVLDNDGPPACSLIAVGKTRIWLAGLEDPNVAWYSKLQQPGLGMQFSAALTVPVSQGEGGLTAIATMDSFVLFFKRTSVWGISGDGPDDTGTNNFFQLPPAKVTTDAGCVDPNSVIEGPNGILFKSAKGYYQLDRSLQASYIGAPVEAFNGQTCKSATLKEDKNQIIFKIEPTDEGVTALVYDYKWDQWYTETQTAAVDAVMWQGVYHYLTSDGRVRYETPGRFLDVATHIAIRLRTFWIKLNGIQGYQRAKRFSLLGDYATPHILITRLAYDFRGYFEDELQLDTAGWINETIYGSDAHYGDSTPYGGDGDQVYLVQGDFPNQRCTAVQLEITEQAASVDSRDPGEGLSLSVLSLQVAVKPGLNRQRVEKGMN